MGIKIELGRRIVEVVCSRQSQEPTSSKITPSALQPPGVARELPGSSRRPPASIEMCEHSNDENYVTPSVGLLSAPQELFELHMCRCVFSDGIASLGSNHAH